MKYGIPIGVVLLVTLSACGDGKSDAARKQAEAANEAQSGHGKQVAKTLELTGFDMPLSVDLPEVQNPMAGNDSLYAQALWVEEFGHLVVRAGDRFAMTIAEEPGDMARLKADMERDMLRKYTVVEEGPDLLIYRSEFPDSPDLVYLHFYQIVHADGRAFVVEDLDSEQFNEADIRFMAAAVRPMPLP